MAHWTISAGSGHELGAHYDGDGVNFAVFSENAHKVELCLFSNCGKIEIQRLILPQRCGSIWHGYVAGLPVGTPYGYRVYGEYAPKQGHRFNHNKLLLDPYARQLIGTWSNADETYGFEPGSAAADLSFDARDSAHHVAKSVVCDPSVFPKLQRLRDQNDGRDLIYEAHPKGLTKLNSEIPSALRGTYEGLASDVMLNHLHALNVKTIELLPVHGFLDEAFLTERQLTNYWGYNSLTFFAPEPRYFGPAGLVGFHQMVQRFHAAEIEVILDVVYNHTGEGDHLGPTLCFRGLDNAAYYRLQSNHPRYYVNDTGTGNTLNLTHPYVLRMVLDSLRFWVEDMGVDGFRFDLATALAREASGFDQHSGFLNAIRQDPVLRKVRLIAEPWDIGPGGYQLGQFPPEFSEWNDQFRDTVRRFWRGDHKSGQDLGARLLGSADRFDHSGRCAASSINFISAHDGFTLADTVAYKHKHNEANTEHNRDGHHTNFSDNCGVEGETNDQKVLENRRQRQRNMLATLFFSQGTPMMLAGDEIGASQYGNNNAYCQDNPIGWINWDTADTDLLNFTRKLSRFRAQHSTFRQQHFLHGKLRPADGLKDVEWCGFDGSDVHWQDPELSQVCLILRSSAGERENAVFVAFNRADSDAHLILPPGAIWKKGFDSALTPAETLALVKSRSVVVFVQRDASK